MRQFLRKRALVAVLSGIALVGMSQPASAAVTNPTFRAQVTPNGIGDLLIFAYWTADERDTLIAITNAFGHQNERYVHLKFHGGTDGDPVREFTICLGEGDVWTAAISSNGREAANATLTVGNPGSCDDTVAGGLTKPPMSGKAGASIIDADFGYIQAYTMECHTGETTGCKVPTDEVNQGASTPPYGNDDGGDDTITGTATLVSASAGFSSSYNATSLIGFDALSESADIRNANNGGRAHQFFSVERCVSQLSDSARDRACLAEFSETDPSKVSSGSARTDVANALASEGGVNKEILMGRYTASPYFDSTTDLILTFPTGDQPQDADAIYDPVSVFTFDEEKTSTFFTTTLDWQVNICTFQNSGDAASASGMTEFSCNGATPAQILGGVNGFTGGWFRILNNNDALNRGIGDGTAVEFNAIGSIPDSNFPVIGLLFSFFQGGTGVFDQAYGIQWAAITGQGGIGDPMFCSDDDGPDYMGCDSFIIASQYQPYSLPGDDMQTFSNIIGRNRRSDSGSMMVMQEDDMTPVLEDPGMAEDVDNKQRMND
jgi:hypothetical protein